MSNWRQILSWEVVPEQLAVGDRVRMIADKTLLAGIRKYLRLQYKQIRNLQCRSMHTVMMSVADGRCDEVSLDL